MPNEADTCRRYVVPKLQAAGWEDEPHRINEQVYFTDGPISQLRGPAQAHVPVAEQGTAADMVFAQPNTTACRSATQTYEDNDGRQRRHTFE